MHLTLFISIALLNLVGVLNIIILAGRERVKSNSKGICNTGTVWEQLHILVKRIQ